MTHSMDRKKIMKNIIQKFENLPNIYENIFRIFSINKINEI